MASNTMPRPQSQALNDFARATTPIRSTPPPRIALKQDEVKMSLARLVLSLAELLREILERQAIRRMESGALTEAAAERIGTAFVEMSEQIEQLKKGFGLEDEYPNIDLSPLGKLL